MNDEDILKYFENKKFNISINDDIIIVKYLANRFDDALTLKESFYRIKYKIYKRPICKFCGKPLKFIGKENEVFQKTCGNNKCQYKSRKESMLKNYNVINVFQLESVKEKIVNTCLKKYGVTSPKKINSTTEKYKQTCLKKYGVENAFQCEEIKNKYKQTCLEKYGVDHNWKIPEEQEKSHSKEALKKCSETKRKNNTFNKSKDEDESYNLLKEKYPDIIRQYKSKEYPFNCDFYIPSLNLYIECNYFWTHGYRPYIGNEEDIKQVKEWKDNNTDFYDNAIETWTIRDVEKRNKAKENNLNYLEFFSIFELQNWLNNYDRK